MSTTPTLNKGLLQVTVGSELDTWGPFVNQNSDILDANLGGSTTVALTNVPVTLSSAQYQNNLITFTGALGANVTVTLPAIGSFYTMQNLTTNTSLYQVTLATTVAGSQHIGLPWGEAIDVTTDSANVKFCNLGRVGTYLDIGSSYVPGWVNACSVPPYLYCNGSSFNTTTYPVLSRLFANSAAPGFLPDCRGRSKFALDDGANVNTNWVSNVLLNGGGSEGIFLTQSEMEFSLSLQIDPSILGAGSFRSIITQAPQYLDNMPPMYIGGITLIRAG